MADLQNSKALVDLTLFAHLVIPAHIAFPNDY
jgi:hypothetical protein